MEYDWRYLTDCIHFSRGKCLNLHCVYRHNRVIPTITCKHWINYNCYDVNCKYSHPSNKIVNNSTILPSLKKDAQTTINITSQESLNAIISDGNILLDDVPICKFFIQMKCKLGKECKFKHELPSIEYSSKRKISEDQNQPVVEPQLAIDILEKYSFSNMLSKKKQKVLNDLSFCENI